MTILCNENFDGASPPALPASFLGSTGGFETVANPVGSGNVVILGSGTDDRVRFNTIDDLDGNVTVSIRLYWDEFSFVDPDYTNSWSIYARSSSDLLNSITATLTNQNNKQTIGGSSFTGGDGFGFLDVPLPLTVQRWYKLTLRCQDDVITVEVYDEFAGLWFDGFGIGHDTIQQVIVANGGGSDNLPGYQGYAQFSTTQTEGPSYADDFFFQSEFDIEMDPDTISDGFLFGSPDLELTDEITLSPDAISDGFLFGSPDLELPQSISPDGLDEGFSFGSPDLIMPLTISPDGLDEGFTFGSPTLELSIALTLAPDGILDGFLFGEPDLLLPESISPDGLDEGFSFGSPTIIMPLTISPTSQASGFMFGSPSLAIDGVYIYSGSGSIIMGGTAPLQVDRNVIGSGGIMMYGSAITSYSADNHFVYEGDGTVYVGSYGDTPAFLTLTFEQTFEWLECGG